MRHHQGRGVVRIPLLDDERHDGNLVAHFRYNPESGRLDPVSDEGTRTIFMVMREGRLVFEGTLRELEACGDSYVDKFVKRPEKDAA